MDLEFEESREKPASLSVPPDVQIDSAGNKLFRKTQMTGDADVSDFVLVQQKQRKLETTQEIADEAARNLSKCIDAKGNFTSNGLDSASVILAQALLYELLARGASAADRLAQVINNSPANRQSGIKIEIVKDAALEREVNETNAKNGKGGSKVEAMYVRRAHLYNRDGSSAPDIEVVLSMPKPDSRKFA